jgi:hypothetical protein
MASATDNPFWALLKIVFRGAFLAKTCAIREANTTQTTLIQCGAIAALARIGMKDRDPDDSLPVW